MTDTAAVAVKGLFWGSLGALAWTHALYPPAAAALARLRERHVAKRDIEPAVTLVVAAYNEETVIGRRLENLRALDYPAEKLELVVTSDASSDRTEELAAAAGARACAGAVARLRRERDVWTLDYDGRRVCLQDAKGLRHLAALLASPQTPIPAVALAAPDVGPAGAAIVMAARRARAAELREELAEARSFNDPERVRRVVAELEELAGELACDHTGGGPLGERARVNVTRAIRAALRRIAEHEPELGRQLHAAIRTGSACTYEPDADMPLRWEIVA